jgi:hypothetical protein
MATNFSQMLISGWGIGSASQYLMWAGPYNSNVNAAAVNNANAKFYIDYAGNAFFAGTLAANIITANNIVSNGITRTFRTTASAVSWTNQTGVTLISNTVTVSGGPIDIDLFVNISFVNASSNVGFDLYRNGTLIDTNGLYALSGSPQYQPAYFTFRDTPGAGTHTYSVIAKSVGSNYNQTASKATMSIIDNKTES